MRTHVSKPGSRGSSHTTPSSSTPNSSTCSPTKPIATISKDLAKNTPSNEKLAVYSKQLRADLVKKLRQLCEGFKQKESSTPFQDHNVKGIEGPSGKQHSCGSKRGVKDGSLTLAAVGIHMREAVGEDGEKIDGPYFFQLGSPAYEKLSQWKFKSMPLPSILEENEEGFPWDRNASTHFDSAGVEGEVLEADVGEPGSVNVAHNREKVEVVALEEQAGTDGWRKRAGRRLKRVWAWVQNSMRDH